MKLYVTLLSCDHIINFKIPGKLGSTVFCTMCDAGVEILDPNLMAKGLAKTSAKV
jgi:hypothetical protein